MITLKLLEEFNERIMKNNFIYRKYSCIDYKNKWSIIASCRDWLSVSLSYLSEHPTPQRSNNDNSYSINVYTYISCIDMVYESICQLHRVLINTKSVPFEGSKDVFSGNKHCKDDNTYFKMIRACFGAHPVNLNDYFTSNKKEQRYASWSGSHFGSKDFSVILYSNDPNTREMCFSIQYSELTNFLERSYNYLQTLIDHINNLEDAYRKELVERKIKKDTDPLIQISILESELMDRYDFDMYKLTLHILRIVFSSPISSSNNTEHVTKYRHSLLHVIDELYNALQSMDCSTVEIPDHMKSPHLPPYSVQTGFSEIEQAILSTTAQPFIFAQCLVEYIEQYVEVTGKETIAELYTLAQTAFFIRHNTL